MSISRVQELKDKLFSLVYAREEDDIRLFAFPADRKLMGRIKKLDDEIFKQAKAILSFYHNYYDGDGRVSHKGEMTGLSVIGTVTAKAKGLLAEKRKSEEWIRNVIEIVKEGLEARIESFARWEPPPESDPLYKKYKDKEKIYPKLEKMVATSRRARGRDDVLGRIIRGYIVEFMHQSEEEIKPCNIMDHANPEAADFWKDKPTEELIKAKVAGVSHTAMAYNRIKSESGVTKLRVTHWEALKEVISTCCKVFKQEYPKFNPEKEPRASVYNDPLEIVRLASAAPRKK